MCTLMRYLYRRLIVVVVNLSFGTLDILSFRIVQGDNSFAKLVLSAPSTRRDFLVMPVAYSEAMVLCYRQLKLQTSAF